jgi:hypothetical protein
LVLRAKRPLLALRRSARVSDCPLYCFSHQRNGVWSIPRGLTIPMTHNLANSNDYWKSVFIHNAYSTPLRT